MNVECAGNYTGGGNYKYVIHFSYRNDNSTPVFIPAGQDNNLKPQGVYEYLAPPELFMPGTGYFDVYSNTLPVTWTVASYQSLIKQTAKAVATSTSPNCGYVSSITNNISAAQKALNNTIQPAFQVYPNPAVNRVTLEVTNATIMLIQSS